MLPIYRIDHIGHVVADLEGQLRLLEGLFGFRRTRTWESPEAGCRGVLLDVPGSRGHRWEVLEPVGDDSPYQAFLDGPLGPGLHHVAVQVTDLDAAETHLRGLGTEVAEGPGRRWIDAAFAPPDGPAAGLQLRIFAPPALATCGDDGAPRPAPKASSDAPNLGIVAIEQVGQAHTDRDELRRWCERAAGMQEVYRTPDGEWPDMATMVLTIPGSGIRWEIIQPVGEESFVQRFIDKRGAHAHHVTFEVADWNQAMRACEHHEIPTMDLNEGKTDGASWCDAFIHPKHAGGFLVQLYWEERPGVWSRSDKVPPRR